MAPDRIAARFRSYRTSRFTIVWLVFLGAISTSGSRQVKSISSREAPPIAAIDSVLAKHFQLQGESGAPIDPQIRRLAEQRRDMETTLHNRVKRWQTVSVACLLAIAIAILGGLLRFARHMFTESEDDARLRTARSDPLGELRT
jgi:hypothetical protein